MQNLIEKPIPPDSSDCCGNGCSPCVWDFYYEQLQRWQQQEEEQREQRQRQQTERPLPTGR